MYLHFFHRTIFIYNTMVVSGKLEYNMRDSYKVKIEHITFQNSISKTISIKFHNS